MTASEPVDFDHALKFIERKTGITLPETNYRQVRSYLEERTRALGIDLAGLLEIIDTGEAERKAFLDAVTINETYFFREERHFAALEHCVFPALKDSARPPIRIWSAACSTGEEALSLAVLAEKVWKRGSCKVFATDINSRALDHLRRGVYGRNSFRDDGKGYRSLMDRYLIEEEGGCRVSPELIDSLNVWPVNLSASEYPDIPRDIHVVFLRNMLIYTKFDLRVKILADITSLLAEGGYLFLSSSEVPLLAHPDLVLETSDGCYFFRKKTLREKRDGTTPRAEVLSKHAVLPKTPEDPGFARDRKPGSIEILRHVNRRLNNPVYEVPDDQAFPAALEYLETMFFLNSGDLTKAEKGVRRLIKLWGANEITDYLQGLTALRKEDDPGAKAAFEEALRKDPGFWPAAYQRALLLRGKDPKKAEREFSACLRSIEGYISRGAFTYQFLLEGFNAKYFAGICEGWIVKLRSKGAAHGA